MLKQRGFTLIEIAIAIVVIALLLAGLLGPLSVRIEQANRQETQALLDEIKEALYGFAVTNGRLPCPDTGDDGHEDRGGPPFHLCSTPFDFLPSADLGVARTDAWGRRFQYGVTLDFADEDPATVGPGGCVATSTTITIALCSVGIGCIKNSAAAVGCNVGSGIPAVVISYGANGGEPPTPPDETENGSADTNFVHKDYSRVPVFDDLVAWISPHILKNRMVAAGRLP